MLKLQHFRTKLPTTGVAQLLGNRVQIALALVIILCSTLISFVTTAWITSEIKPDLEPWVGPRAVARLDYQPLLQQQNPKHPDFSSATGRNYPLPADQGNPMPAPAEGQLDRIVGAGLEVVKQTAFPVNLVNPHDQLVLRDRIAYATNWNRFEPRNQWIRGRYPVNRQEIALSPQLASRLNLQIGDTLVMREAGAGNRVLPDETVTLVGIFKGSQDRGAEISYQILTSPETQEELAKLAATKGAEPAGSYTLSKAALDRRVLALAKAGRTNFLSRSQLAGNIDYYFLYGASSQLTPELFHRFNQQHWRVLTAEQTNTGPEQELDFGQQLLQFLPYGAAFFSLLLLLLLPWSAVLIRGQSKPLAVLYQIGFTKRDLVFLLGGYHLLLGALGTAVGLFFGYSLSQAFVTTHSGTGWKVLFFAILIWILGTVTTGLAALFPLVALLRRRRFEEFRPRPKKRSYRVLATGAVIGLIAVEIGYPLWCYGLGQPWQTSGRVHEILEIFFLSVLVPSELHLLARFRPYRRGWLLTRMVGVNLGHYLYRSVPLVIGITVVTTILGQQILLSFDRGGETSLPKQSVTAYFTDMAGNREFRQRELDRVVNSLVEQIGPVRSYRYQRGTPAPFNPANGTTSQPDLERYNQVLSANNLLPKQGKPGDGSAAASSGKKTGLQLPDVSKELPNPLDPAWKNLSGAEEFKPQREREKPGENEEKDLSKPGLTVTADTAQNWWVFPPRDLLVFNKQPGRPVSGPSIYQNLSVLAPHDGVVVDRGELLRYFGFSQETVTEAKEFLRHGGVIVNYPAYPWLLRGERVIGQLQNCHLPIVLTDGKGNYYPAEADGKRAEQPVNTAPVDSYGQPIPETGKTAVTRSETTAGTTAFTGETPAPEQKTNSSAGQLPLKSLLGGKKEPAVDPRVTELRNRSFNVQVKEKTAAQIWFVNEKRPVPEFVLLSPETAKKLHLSLLPAGMIAVPEQLVLPGALWNYQETQTNQFNGHLQLVTQGLDRYHFFWLLTFLPFGFLLLMAIVGMVVTLNAWEIKRDFDVLDQIGASRRLVRQYSALAGVYLGLAGVVPGLVVVSLGRLFGNWLLSRLNGIAASYWPPMTWLLMFSVGVSMLAVAGVSGWLFSPRRKPKTESE